MWTNANYEQFKSDKNMSIHNLREKSKKKYEIQVF